MKTGAKIAIIFIIVIAIGALAYVIYKVTRSTPPPQSNPNTLPNTGYTGGGSGSGSGSGNNTPPPPTPTSTSPAGKTALAKTDGVQVYYSSPFGPYKVANKGEWIGTVIRTYENGDYYLIDDGSSPNKLVFVTQVTLV